MKHYAWISSILSVLFLAGLGLASSPSCAEEFSAEQATITRSTTEVSALHYRPDRWRLEVKGKGHSDIAIFRLDKKLIWILLPNDKRYMQAVLAPEDLPLPGRIPGEIDRSVVGQEDVEGFVCDKVVVRYSKGDETCEMIFWVSRKLGVPLRSEAPDLGWKTEVQKIQLGPQPDSLFEIPADYEFFDPPMDILR
jgi:hypothetical protein